MIRTTNVRGGFIDSEEVRYVTRDVFEKWTRRLLPKRGDIVLTREAPLGSVGMLRTDDRIFLGQRLYHFRINRSIADPNFVLYALMGPDLQGQIRGFGSGSTVEHMRLSDIELLEVDVPPRPLQERLGGILAAYDELIENCERRIRVLDEMARALYREWFVNFRYPGHDRVPLVDSPIGRVPGGWQVRSAAEVLEINPKVALPREGERPFVPMTSLSNDTMVISDLETRHVTVGSKFKNGDTLFARITPCLENGKTGFVQFLPDDMPGACGSTEFIVLRGRTVSSEFTYCLSRSDEFREHAIKSMSGATGRQRVQERCFNQYLLAQPPAPLLQRFTEIARPMFRFTEEMSVRTTNLRKTRDLLLPRILSGQLSVADLAA
jgi:type I restriction enzyme S subunit